MDENILKPKYPNLLAVLPDKGYQGLEKYIRAISAIKELFGKEFTPQERQFNFDLENTCNS